MGEYKHNAMIVTACRSGNTVILKAREKAINIFGIERISNIMQSPFNGFKTFMIIPDGSKENWKESDEEDAKRDLYAKEIRRFCFGDGSSYLDFVDVAYGSVYREENRVENSF